MRTVAILGAGAIGAAVAERIAGRAVCRAVRLIDDGVDVAAGKALDLRQSGPLGRYDVDLSASADPLAAAGASVVVLADPVQGPAWEGDRGLSLLRMLQRAGVSAPIVFAGPSPSALMELAWRELRIPASRLVGSAPGAVASALRALVGLELQLSGAAVELVVVGRPPGLLPVWSSATVGGSLVTDRVPAHRLAALAQGTPRLWPPGPAATAAVTARIVEALASGTRRLHQGMTVIDGDLDARGVAVALPLELGPGGVRRHVLPSLSPQERTDLLNAIARAGVTAPR